MHIILAVFLIGISAACSAAQVSDPRNQEPTFDITREMALIPAGKFKRGCDQLGPEHGAPASHVYIDAFMMDIYEVTNQRLEAVMPDHKLRRSKSSACDDCPVSKITWYEAADFCHLIGKALPSEAQWEKAAGGKDGCEFSWGPDFKSENSLARGGLELRDKASPVGSYPPNKYGLYDMAGNMWEWVADWYSPRYYMRDVMYNPRGPRAGVMKVRRGGAWSDNIRAMLVGYRDWSYPFSRSYSDIGFRCVINLKK